jgi:predicted ATPase/DNA-binding SARP family transcriptional activator
MPTLHIQLLGEFRLSCGDAPVSAITSPRLQALLAYLLLHRQAPQPRQHLAFLLWPDTSEAQARTNLRQLLHALKQALPQADHFVHADAQTLQWRSDAPFRLDVAEFEQALSTAHAAQQQDTAEQQGASHALQVALEQAIALYGGDLLPSCYDDWIVPERERLRQALTGALERVLLLLERAGQPRAAIPYAERLLRHDPLHEEAYRELMRLHAECGDRAGIRRVYQTCATVLERELGVEPSAATREAYEQLLKLDIQVQPVLPPQPATTNLPAQLTSFVGRVAEMAEVRDLLQTTRLLALTGPGGCGKTRLALEAATKVLDDYPNGVWLVELAPLADPTLVAQTVASTLGVREQPGRPILDAVLDYVRTKTLLLILDNCEHLIETCAQLADSLLRAAPHLTILASSREPFGIGGETAYGVPPLALPDPRQLHNLDALAQNDCVHLFVDRAAAAYPPFRLTAKNAPAIAQIGLRLDGMPLAIELAAARTKLFPPEQIAARLDDRFRLLTGGGRTALERHQTLFALIEWSHHLLSEAERVLLRRLSVFAGGWSFEAAQGVCGDGLDDAVLDSLAHLANKSLVVVEEHVEAVEGRYRLLETIRQYARDKLLESGEGEYVRDRHLDFFLRFAEEVEPKLRSADQLAWLERVETEHDNLRTALAWSLESGKSERALELAGALGYFWLLRGYFSEGQRWLEDALALSEGEQRTKAITGDTSGPSRVEMAQRAKVLYGAGRIRFLSLFDPHTSHMIVEESLRLWRELGDKWWMAAALEHVGLMLIMEGDVQASRACLEEGVSLAREVENRWPLALCLIRLAGSMRTDNAAARRIREEGVAVARSVGDKSVLSQGLIGLVTDNLIEGNVTAAAPVAEEALAEACAIGSATHVMFSLIQLVIINCFQGDPAKAKQYCLQALAFAREMGSSQGLLLVLFAFGFAACFSGQPRRGARLLVTAVTLLRQRGIKISDRSERDVMVFWQALERAQQLDSAAFESARAEGQQMTLEQALALATEEESENSQDPKV